MDECRGSPSLVSGLSKAAIAVDKSLKRYGQEPKITVIDWHIIYHIK